MEKYWYSLQNNQNTVFSYLWFCSLQLQLPLANHDLKILFTIRYLTKGRSQLHSFHYSML